MTPEAREHRWVDPTPLVRWRHCGDCGVIKRTDGLNSKVCKGPPKITVRKFSVDPKSYELAEHFLPADVSEAAKQALSQAIQDTVEDWTEAHKL